MIMAFCGLHGCGKSHLSGILVRTFGWTYVNKREVLEKLFNKSFPSPQSHESMEWHRSIYQSIGAAELMVLILGSIKGDSHVIFDAVHNPLEWDAIKGLRSDAMLAGVFAPQAVRNARNTALDGILDRKRIRYWHDDLDSGFRCLMSEVEWAFTGTHDESLQIRECEALVSYLGVR